MRKYIRITTYLCAAVLMLAAAAAVGTVRSARYRRELENVYARAVIGLAESVTGIDTELHRCLCAGSPESFTHSAERIRTFAELGKLQAGELPVIYGDWDGIEQFLSQVGGCVCAAEGKTLPDDDCCDSLIALSDSAEKLRLLLENFIAIQNDGGMWHEEWERLAFHSRSITENDVSALAETGKCFGECPHMEYDGAYAETAAEPALTRSAGEITPSAALEAAAGFAGGRTIYLSGEANGAMEEYIFSSTDRRTEIAVTKRGGIVSRMMSETVTGGNRLTEEQAETKADIFLRRAGMKDMVRLRYEVSGGECLLSFVPSQDNILLYPDIVRVSVASGSGEIIGYDASDYIMNHRSDRSLVAEKTRLEAEKAVSPLLTVTDSRLVLIPTDGAKEKLCYEFICTRWDGGEAAVYINASDLTEERVLLLSRTADGITVN